MSRPVAVRTGLLAVLSGVLAFTTAELVSRPEARAFFSPEFLGEWFRVGRIMRIARTRYVDADRVTFDKLGRAADAGAVSGLDRYSEFLDTDAYAEQNRRSDQLYTGIGILVGSVDGIATIDKVYAGGGAAAAGLLPGDRIVAIDGEKLSAGPDGPPLERLRGKEGTVAKLGVFRPGATAPFDAEVVRRTVTVPTVSVSSILPDGRTGYVVLDGFERRSAGEIAEAFAALRKRGADRLVLDLRGNPGGLVDAAVETVGLFVPKGTLVARLSGRSGEESETYLTPNAPAFPGTPLVLLVDGASASASEIVAGALQDHGRALLVGAKTFGKGIVQSIYNLDDTTGLKLTTARYALPRGRLIHGKGVAPDIVAGESAAASDRRRAETTLANNTGGDPAFARRFGYRPSADEALALAVSLLDAAERRHG